MFAHELRHWIPVRVTVKDLPCNCERKRRKFQRKMEVEERRHTVSVGQITHQTHTHTHTHTHTELWWVFLAFDRPKKNLDVFLSAVRSRVCVYLCVWRRGQGNIISVRWSLYIWHQSLTHCLFGPHRNTHTNTHTEPHARTRTHTSTLQNSANNKDETSKTSYL